MSAMVAAVVIAAPSLGASEVNSESAAIVQKVMPTVVSITVRKEERSAPAPTKVAVAEASGALANIGANIKTFVASGFVIDPSGVIVTNYRVVENAFQITVTFSNGTVLS